MRGRGRDGRVGVVLTSLLPGLRELRAPLAAGTIWLLAGWFAAEPWVPASGEATGIVASAYRLGEFLKVLGLGAVLAFSAYLVGALSVFVFSGLLKRAMRTSRPYRLLDPLSDAGRESLQQIARDARQRLEDMLSLSGYSLDELLPHDGEEADRRTGDPPKWIPRRRRRLRPIALTSSSTAERPQEWLERRLAALVVEDLEIIADAQLLGEQTEVFSAVDRDRAEVDFRIAVVPGVVVLAAVLALHQNSVLPAVVLAVAGVAIASGLMLDAARQQRLANDLLLNLVENGRIVAPSVKRLEVRAEDLNDQSPVKVASRQARQTSLAIRSLLDALTSVPNSTATPGLRVALEAAVTARAEFDRLQNLIRQASSAYSDGELDDSILRELEAVLRGWAAINHGLLSALPEFDELLPAEGEPAPSSAELLDTMRRIREQYPIVVGQMRSKIVSISNQEAASRTVPG